MFNEMMRAEIWLQETLNSQLSIEDLATRMGYSSSQVRRRFRQSFGISPSAYRDMLRLEKAARMLIHTPYGVHDIARCCGYRNHSAFTRAFQRRYRVAPREYRQNQRLELYRQRHSLPHFSVRLLDLPLRRAAVTRLYQPPELIDNLDGWKANVEGAYDLPARLNNAAPIAILHDHPMASEAPRVDIGVHVDEEHAHRLALPLPFRLVMMPAQRYACIDLADSSQLGSAMMFMACRSMSEHGVYLSGDAPQLVKSHNGLELRLPVLEEE
ncbi:helix-turn-helix transcriptional regulator [Halomonas binhaiensis]|uniref:Helix-turn-helix transcriptional regulator n=1 Tax=Halomonas binhaiensis TaxID=2562282 RepID=A0A856QQL1_9GAMM|nr:helix-turn-helix transcriptional regulator [Halomonas binhaiensis]QEM82227.2 helix-turn-helix transcriptional regulator [Halomonas binhaiensis]